MQALRAAAGDLVVVIAFAVIGRSSHAESLNVPGVLGTAWPFLVGCGVGLLLSRAWRHPESLRTGVLVWLCTVGVGIALRVLGGDTAQTSFIVVTATTLGLGLLGWRAVVVRRRQAGLRRERQAV